MAGANDLLKVARGDLGMGEPNKTQDWYNREVENLGDWNWSWCAAAVSYWFEKSGNGDLIKPRAYTVYMAQDFQKAKRWYTGTVANLKKAKPGDVVFFDWGGTNSVGAIDHVGIVEKNLGGGRVQTVEGNTDDSVKRRVRDAGSVAGYGRPDWSKAGAPAPSKPTSPSKAKPKTSKAPAFPGPLLAYPPLRKSETCLKWQARMRERGWNIAVDGWYGPASKTACRTFQAEKGLSVDGVVGPNTWRAAWESPIT